MTVRASLTADIGCNRVVRVGRETIKIDKEL